MINLEIVLRKNKTTLSDFIEKNKLTSYSDLLKYCERRKYIPCKEEEYNEINKHEKSKLERKASKPQKKRKARSSSKSK